MAAHADADRVNPRARGALGGAAQGALLHIDAFLDPEVPGSQHWATGERREQHKTRKAGKPVVIDDHPRLVYCELHSAENALNVSATLRRFAGWFTVQGCGVGP